MTPRRIAALVGGIVYTGLLLVSTIGPLPQRLVGSEATHGVLSLRSWFELDTWASGRPLEFIANVAVFVPWGALALVVVGRRRWWIAALGGIALTLAIEIAQIPLARISDPRDLVANTLGTLIGVAAAVALAPRRVRPPSGAVGVSSNP